MSATTSGYFGAVIFLDMLGTKGIWKRRSPDDVIKNYKETIDVFRSGVAVNNEMVQKHAVEIGGRIENKITAFSDTIVMTVGTPISEKEKVKSAYIIFTASLGLPSVIALGINYDIYFRGAISFGTFYTVDNMVIGPAVDEAAQYYMLPEWVGISAAPSMHYALSNLSGSLFRDPRRYYTQWDIPIKTGIEKKGLAINWPKKEFYEQREEHKDAWNTIFSKIENTIEKEVQSTDVDVSLKWRNTKWFYDANRI